MVEDLLEEAKRRYPVGTIYMTVDYYRDDLPETVEHQTFSYSGLNCIFAEAGKGILYNNGSWAEIIESPNKIYELW